MKPSLPIRIQKFALILFLLTLYKLGYGQQMPTNFKSGSSPDTINIKYFSYLLPQSHPKWHYYQSLSFSYVDIPAAWALQKVNAPLITYSAKFSLPKSFELQASLATVYVSNRLNFGPSWNHSIDNYHFGVGYQIDHDFGQLNQFGYKTKFSAWGQQAFATVGYSFEKMALVVRGDLYLTNSVDFDEAGHSVPMWHSFTNGYSISASLEQRLYRNKVFSIGFKLNNIRYHFLAWPAFPVNQNNYWVPEIQLGIKL